MKIVTVDNVSKQYRLSRLGARSIREDLTRVFSRGAGPEREEFYALRDVSCEIEQGEAVGFIGPNGSGKSTMLKLLARIIYPTRGKIIVRGSVASLIEVGAGFHPELSGRENIFLYGSIMGMKQADVRAKFDRIVEFAELERFIDTPVKRYSSGMYVRLGFAVAAHINPNVLLVDEVLAVGDAAFQSKCQQRIEELQRNGMTIVFVSHDMAAVERLCSRVFFIHQAQIRAVGHPQDVIGDYYSEVLFKSVDREGHDASALPAREPVAGGSDARITGVRFLDRDGIEADTMATGQPMRAQIEYVAHRRIDDPVFELFFYSADDRLHCHYTTATSAEQVASIEGRGIVEVECEEFGLAPGIFKVDAVLQRRGALAPLDWKQRQYLLKVQAGKRIRGLFHSPHRWRFFPGESLGKSREV